MASVKRTLIAAAAALVLAGAAGAKGPESARLCGSSGCVTVRDAATIDAITAFAAPFQLAEAPGLPAPFYTVVLRDRAPSTPFVRLIDSHRMRRAGDVDLPSVPTGLAWIGSRLLVAGVAADAALDSEFVGIDPMTRRIRWQSRIVTGSIAASARTPGGVGFLLVPNDNMIGHAGLATLSRDGRVRSVALARIRAGTGIDESTSQVTTRRPGLAIDPGRNRAFVVDASGLIAEVDLSSLAVSYHSAPRVTAAAHKVLSGASRQALWIGDGILAVSGWDATATASEIAPDELRTSFSPAGVRLVDTRTWTSRAVDSTASSIVAADGFLLASGGSPEENPRAVRGAGLSAYGRHGQLHFHVLGTEPVDTVQLRDGRAYAWSFPRGAGRRSIAIVDLSTGTVLHQLERSTVLTLL